MSLKETDLYPPVKAFLEGQGFEVRAEVNGCDVVAKRGQGPVLIVELKTGLTIQLLYQGVDRLALSDLVYLAIPKKSGRLFYSQMKRAVKLCRRIGLGLMLVRLDDGFVEVLAEPGAYQPRKNNKAIKRLEKEFDGRESDRNIGGQVGQSIVTAYRFDCETLAKYLVQTGPLKGSEIAKATGVVRATRIMADNHYGWFFRVERGVYHLSKTGMDAARELGRT